MRVTRSCCSTRCWPGHPVLADAATFTHRRSQHAAHLRPMRLLLKKCSLKSSTTSKPASLRTLQNVALYHRQQGKRYERQSSQVKLACGWPVGMLRAGKSRCERGVTQAGLGYF